MKLLRNLSGYSDWAMNGKRTVALDGSYPKERVAFMVEDAQVSVVLTEARLLEKLPASEEQPVARRRVHLAPPHSRVAETSTERICHVSHQTADRDDP